MSLNVRRLIPDDQPAAWHLGSIAFGYTDRRMPESWTSDTPGRQSWGVFDDTGELLAKAVDRDQGQWFGGRLVPTCGVAGVAVAPEARGHGLGRMVLTHLLHSARDRGAVISTLFDTTPGPYRRLGWEEVGALVYHSLPTMALAGLQRPEHVRLRSATDDDVPRLQEIYRQAARASTGMMERSGPLFPVTPADFRASYDGITAAIGTSGDVEGYASWKRSNGYDAAGTLTVEDLVAVTPDATVALLANAGSWTSVAPTLLIRLPHPDPAWTMMSTVRATLHSRQPWMLRVVDAAGAVAARGWPVQLEGGVDLELEDEVCPWNAGRYRLLLSGGDGRLEPGGSGQLRLTARGLALLYAGVAGPALLRRVGLLAGGNDSDDAFVQTATAGPAPNLLDYF